jgi:hypothetical protein
VPFTSISTHLQQSEPEICQINGIATDQKTRGNCLILTSASPPLPGWPFEESSTSGRRSRCSIVWKVRFRRRNTHAVNGTDQNLALESSDQKQTLRPEGSTFGRLKLDYCTDKDTDVWTVLTPSVAITLNVDVVATGDD